MHSVDFIPMLKFDQQIHPVSPVNSKVDTVVLATKDSNGQTICHNFNCFVLVILDLVTLVIVATEDYKMDRPVVNHILVFNIILNQPFSGTSPMTRQFDFQIPTSY